MTAPAQLHVSLTANPPAKPSCWACGATKGFLAHIKHVWSCSDCTRDLYAQHHAVRDGAAHVAAELIEAGRRGMGVPFC